MNTHESVRIIREEHTVLASLFQALAQMIERGPADDLEGFFDVMRAMLFYIDEYPTHMHHPKESELLFPAVVRLAPEVSEVVSRLENDHARGESMVRELQHLLLAWELMGNERQEAFTTAAATYLAFSKEHMRLEETVVLHTAQKVLTDADWALLDAAFATNCDPLSGRYARNPMYDRLITHIIMRAPAPIGMGKH